MSSEQQFIALNIAVLTISDSRTEDDDVSGKPLVERVEKAGHSVYQKTIVADETFC